MKNSAVFRLHLIVFIWGFTAVLGKLIQAGAYPLTFYRMLFAAFFLFIYLRMIRKESIAVPRRLLLQLVGIGGLMAAHWLCFFYSIKVSNVSIALSCMSLSTLFAAFIEPMVYRRRIDLTELLLGIVIVFCIGLIFRTEFHYKEGIVVGIVCALLGTIFSVLNGKIFGKTSAGNIIFYEIFGGWLLMAIYFTISGDIFSFTEISSRDLALILLLASVFTAYPMFESVRLMQYISPFTLILTVNLEPVYGIILAYLIFGESEHMSPMFYLASLGMILAIVVNGIIKAKQKSVSQYD